MIRLWLRTLPSEVIVLVAIVAAVVLLCAAGFVVNVQVEQASCARVGSQSSYQTRYDGGGYFTRECYVRQDDGRWVPLDKWRGIDE